MPLTMSQTERLRFAARYSTRHLLISTAVALLAAMLVFLLWYPAPTARLLNVGNIYLLMLAVDVVCGPVLTLVLASPAKPRRELIQDLCIVALLQLVALAYGLYTLEKGRPVAYVFEQDRLVLVTKNELYTAECTPQCTPGTSLMGIEWHMAEVDNSKTTLQSLDLSLQGISPAMRPMQWKNWDWHDPKLQARLRPLSALSKEKLGDISHWSSGKYSTRSDILYLPLVSSRKLDWIALFDDKGNWLDALPVDGF